MGFLSGLFYFIIVICILVTVHEFGHFISARMCGIRAEIFSVGFTTNPDKFRLCGFNKISGFTFGNLAPGFDTQGYTDYRLSLFPIGGFVKIAGMIDESMDKDFLEKEPQPYEFRSKNAFQKAFVLSAGVIMNILCAIIFFAIVSMSQGRMIFQTTSVGYIQNGSFGDKIGLQKGDRLININNRKVYNWDDCLEYLTFKDFGRGKSINVIRNGQLVNLKIDAKTILKTMTNEKSIGIEPENMSTFLVAVDDKKPAGRIGLKSGDTMIAINNVTLSGSFLEFTNFIKKNKGTKITLVWKRGNAIMHDTLTPTPDGLIGVQLSETYTGKSVHETYNFLQATNNGCKMAYTSCDLFISSIWQIVKGNLSLKQSVGGPVMIAKSASQNAEMGWAYFLQFMGLLSISLAVINILPFPALDGGHLVFVVIEGITRREVSAKIKMVFQQVGMFVLLAFMLFVVYNDIVR